MKKLFKKDSYIGGPLWIYNFSINKMSKLMRLAQSGKLLIDHLTVASKSPTGPAKYAPLTVEDLNVITHSVNLLFDSYISKIITYALVKTYCKDPLKSLSGQTKVNPQNNIARFLEFNWGLTVVQNYPLGTSESIDIKASIPNTNKEIFIDYKLIAGEGSAIRKAMSDQLNMLNTYSNLNYDSSTNPEYYYITMTESVYGYNTNRLNSIKNKAASLNRAFFVSNLEELNTVLNNI